jgi:uncharacterized tellurite resistance protein B-like protein
MIQSLLQRLLAPQPARLPEPDARLALATLMVRLARTDGEYSAAEVARIDRVLCECYGLSPFEAAGLRTNAEAFEAEAPDTVRFTRAIKAATEHEDRVVLVQALWSVALADGARDADEDQLMRLVASLLGVTDVESGLARQKAARS